MGLPYNQSVLLTQLPLPLQRNLRHLELSPAQLILTGALIESRRVSEEACDFNEEVKECNPFTALLIVEADERNTLYRTGTTKALVILLMRFIRPAVIKNDFSTPIWALTTEKLAKIKDGQRMFCVSAKHVNNVIKFPGRN